jgi:hypothetical protein
VRVLLDNNISPLVARAINTLVEADGDRVVALRDEFPADAPDVQWIGELGRRGAWVVISGDVQITRRAAERAAWRSSGLVGFFFEPSWSRFKNTEKAARLLLWWPRIREQAGLVAGGAMFQLPIKAGSKLKQLQVERR